MNSQTRSSRDRSTEPAMSTIPVNQPLWMNIDLELNNFQLLLLNRSQNEQGQNEQLLICPSTGYAPNPIIRRSPTLLPQKDSWAVENNEKFTFETVGVEEFLAIGLKTPIDLPWLVLSEEEPLLEWDAPKFDELLEQLTKQNDWQVFYQSVEVKASN